MKHKLSGFLLAVGSFALLNVALAFGIESNGIRVTVPFQFRVGKTLLPAGSYLIQSADDYFPNLLVIRNENGSPTIETLTKTLSAKVGTPVHSELVFEKVGKQEYLSQVWEGGSRIGDGVSEPALATANPSASQTGSSNSVPTQHAPHKR